MVTWLGVSVHQVEAATPVDEAQDLNELCALGPPKGADEAGEIISYHKQRRAAVHGVYETELQGLDEGLFRYDRVSGLLTLSGFRTFEPLPGGPSIRFRNECILSFEMDEDQALDLLARVAMGTAHLRIGFLLAAHEDYDTNFCPNQPEGPQLQVDLLYAEIIESDGGEAQVIDTYQTPLGHRRALQQSLLVVDAARQQLPEIKVSHLQWRAPGGSWEDEVDDETQDLWNALSTELEPHLERTIYPCYIRALARNASLQGALVLEVPLVDEGIGEVRFLMDTLGDATVRSCVQERIDEEEAISESPPSTEAEAFKATILMRRR